MIRRPFLSVIMPVYNTAAFLSAAVESVLLSDVKDLELICVDDGSDDGSVRLLQMYAAKDNRLLVVEQEHAGVSAARNEGLRRASGQYITFVDSDDSVTPSFFRELLEAAQRSGVACVVAGWTIVTDEGSSSKPLVTRIKRCKISPYVLGELPKNSWGSVYARSVLERSSASFPPGVSYGEDMVFNYCVWSNCDSVILHPSVGYNYHVRKDSLSDSVRSTVVDLMRGGEFLLDYWKRRCMLTEENREYLLCFLVHSLRRARSYGSREMLDRFEQWIKCMVCEAGIEQSDFVCLREKDARALLAILRGSSGMGLVDYVRRGLRCIRQFFQNG